MTTITAIMLTRYGGATGEAEASATFLAQLKTNAEFRRAGYFDYLSDFVGGVGDAVGGAVNAGASLVDDFVDEVPVTTFRSPLNLASVQHVVVRYSQCVFGWA
eukprot:2478452-Rhodomonas_salina.1